MRDINDADLWIGGEYYPFNGGDKVIRVPKIRKQRDYRDTETRRRRDAGKRLVTVSPRLRVSASVFHLVSFTERASQSRCESSFAGRDQDERPRRHAW